METICYKNHEALKRAFCYECERLRRDGCRNTDPMDCCIVKAKLMRQVEDGYNIQVGKFIVLPKSELMEYREFNDDDLDLIRDLLADHMSKSLRKESAEEILQVINVCQAKLNCPTFNSVEQFFKNKSNSWNEIVEGDDE